MANEGQIVLGMLVPFEEGHNPVDVTWSVSNICDTARHTVIFDANRLIVSDAKCIFAFVFQRNGNLHIGRMKIRNLSHPRFGGHGK